MKHNPGKTARRFLPRSLLALGVLALLLVVLSSCGGAGESGGRAGMPACVPSRVSVERLRAHVAYLASDELGGRKTGTRGVEKAEAYIARSFRRHGLRPVPGREDHFLGFTVYRHGFDRSGTTLALVSGGREIRAVPGEDFRPFAFSPDGSWEGEVVFAGYGITAPEYGYDDYEGLDVEGKIVLVLRYEPSGGRYAEAFEGESLTRHALFSRKAENAEAHGAAAMLLFDASSGTPGAEDLRLHASLSLEPDPRSLDSTPGRRGRDRPRFPALHISRELARSITGPAGWEPEDLEAELGRGNRASDISLGGTRTRFSVRRLPAPEEVDARNVAGFLQGTDPALREEWVLVGAHHDHLGSFTGEGDTVHNGADDNASGVAGMLEIARLMSERKPQRSILFVAFAAEEEGLLGSRVLVDEQIPAGTVVFMLNLDMIGRNPGDPVLVGGDGYARGVRDVVSGVQEALKEAVRPGEGVRHAEAGFAGGMPDGLELRFAGTRYLGNSDHHPFFERGIPFLAFFTGVHPDYHGPGDEAHKLDYARMAGVVRLAYVVATDLAGRGRVPGFIHHIAWLGLEVEAKDVHHSGVRPAGGEQEHGREEPRLARAVVTGVRPGSRGFAGGFREGDVIISLGGRAVDDPDEIGRLFASVNPGTGTNVTVQGPGAGAG